MRTPIDRSQSAALPLLLCAVVALGACKKDDSTAPPAPVTADLGGFHVVWTADGFSIFDAAHPDAPLLETYSGAAPYTPLAARNATASFTELYGQFKIIEGTGQWSASSALKITDDAHLQAQVSDELGAALGTLKFSSPTDGALVLDVDTSTPGPLVSAYDRLSLSFKCNPGDRFLGFGEQSDALDHRGHTVPLWISEPGIGKTSSDDPGDLWMLVGTRHGSSVGLPTWLSNRGYIGVVETSAHGRFEVCSTQSDAFRAEVWNKSLRLWIFRGTPAEALTRATAGILGRQMRPPPHAFAPWNDAVFGSANVRRIAKLMRDNHIPSSAIWSEDFRGGARPQNSDDYNLTDEYDLDRTLYPDGEQVAQDLHAQGFLWLAYFNTFAMIDSKVWAPAEAAGALIKNASGGTYKFQGPSFVDTSLIDLSTDAGRGFIKQHLIAALDLGFDGWMADYGEWLPHDAVLGDGSDPLLAHNLYGAAWSTLNQQTLTEHDTGRPRVFFSRSGWLGSQKDVPVHWPGDQRTDFESDDGLPTVVPMALNLGFAGWSTTGSDIGGYQSATNAPTTKELFYRWTTLGALTPVMRTHHGHTAYGNWQVDHDADTTAHYGRWARFHTRLFPYLDGGALLHEQTGLPLMRALLLQYPEDAAAWTLMDEYLLGPSLLVAPVQEAGKTSRTVHLPPGRWYTFAGPLQGGGSAPLQGPQDLTAQADITEIPLYVRAGSVLPLLRTAVDTLLPLPVSSSSTSSTPGLTGLADAQAGRDLLVFPGAEFTFAERDASYHLIVDASETTGFRENGTVLPSCTSAGMRGCVEGTAQPDGSTRVRLQASGPLGFSGHRLEITQQGTPRIIDVDVRPAQ
ncbi:MAG: hypothetical protein JST92_15460 [Deltaproteobacteria bacterium]|nr:hypothetical protein [Deltaproteobacteria bacterium]